MTPTEKLIAEARELLTKWNDTSYSFFSFVGDARYLIPALCDALEEAQNDQRWTETEYSPPDDIGQSVWLYSQDGEIVHGEYLGEGWYNLPRGAVHGTYFSHWMPDAKPQPPKGED